MIHARKSTRGAKWYLMPLADIPGFIKYISWAQTQAGIFENVTVKPYTGKKYNPAFQWVVVG